MKFSMSIEKKTRVTVGKTEGHNTRLHPTKSQLPKDAWITGKGRHEVFSWRDDVLDAGKDLAKRKDAVVSIELIIQVGDQTHWREMPTKEHPHGKPKPGAGPKLKALAAGAKEAAIREFGEKNIVGIDLHTDESSPHVHIVVTPVKDGKLNAKHWLDGKRKCALLRSHIYEVIDKHIACEYEKGALGGKPHDPLKRAGGAKGPQVPPSLFKRATEALNVVEQVKRLKVELSEAKGQLQTMFSRLKRMEQQAAKVKDEKAQVELRATAAERQEKNLRQRMTEMEKEMQMLTPKPQHEPLKPAPLTQFNLK